MSEREEQEAKSVSTPSFLSGTFLKERRFTAKDN